MSITQPPARAKLKGAPAAHSNGHIRPTITLNSLICRDLEAANTLFEFYPDFEPDHPDDRAACDACKFVHATGEPYTVETVIEVLQQWQDDAIGEAEAETYRRAIDLIANYSPPRGRGKGSPQQRVQNLLSEAGYTPPPETFEFSTDEDLDGVLTATQWEWQGYIPRGYVTMLLADQDMGKSSVGLSFCQTIISGGLWPDGQPCAPRADVRLLWIDTEGALALFHERRKRYGIPKGRFIFPRDPLQEWSAEAPSSWQWVEAAIERFQPPLIVLDSLSGAHVSKENDNDAMKVILKKFADLAQRHNIAVVIIHHLSKPAVGAAEYPITLSRCRGASSITQFCRSVIALGIPDRNQPDRRRLDVIKLNLAAKPQPVGYILGDRGPEWGDAPNAPAPAQPRRAIDDAIEFLQEALQAGQRPQTEIEAEAKRAGIGDNALKNAKRALGIQSRHEGNGKDGRWFWIRDTAPST